MDGAEYGGLPRTIGPEQGDDSVATHIEAHTAQREDHVAVDDLEIPHRTDRSCSAALLSAGTCRAGLNRPSVPFGSWASSGLLAAKGPTS